MAKRIIKIAGAVVAILAAVLLAYFIYLMATYYRLDDSLPLETQHNEATASLERNYHPGDRLVAVTANLGFGAYLPNFDFFMDGGSGSVAESAASATASIEGSAAAIKKLRPDFILFQEVDTDADRSHHVDELALLQKEFPSYASVFAQNYDSPFLAWPPTAPHGASKAGMATFSHFTMDSSLRRSLPISDSLTKFLDLDRCYAITRFNGPDGHQLVVMNVHLSAYGADESIMEAQRSMLYDDMRREYEAGNYVIVGGDFNHDMLGDSNGFYGNATETEESWAKPFDFAGIPEGFIAPMRQAFENGTFDSAATCRDAGRPYDGTNDRWVMDTFLCSDNIQVESCETLDLDFAYSDHNPVVLTFSLA